MHLIGWIVVAVAVWFGFAYFMFTRESRMLGRLAVALGGENKSSILGGNYVRLDSQGIELQIRLMSGSSDAGHGPLLIILLKTPPTFRMHISPLSWARRLRNTVGVVEDITVGDGDKPYRVKTNNDEEAAAFINDPERSEAISYFFEQGFTDIKLEENDVCLVKPQNLKSDLDPRVMKRHLEHFEGLFPR